MVYGLVHHGSESNRLAQRQRDALQPSGFCVCVCVRERERGKERERGRERERALRWTTLLPRVSRYPGARIYKHWVFGPSGSLLDLCPILGIVEPRWIASYVAPQSLTAVFGGSRTGFDFSEDNVAARSNLNPKSR